MHLWIRCSNPADLKIFIQSSLRLERNGVGTQAEARKPKKLSAKIALTHIHILVSRETYGF